MFGLRGIVFKDFPQSAYELVRCSGCDIAGQVPDVLQQFPLRDDPVWMFQKILEQFHFESGHAAICRSGYFERIQVDFSPVERKMMIGARAKVTVLSRPKSLQQAFHPTDQFVQFKS